MDRKGGYVGHIVAAADTKAETPGETELQSRFGGRVRADNIAEIPGWNNLRRR